MRLAVIGKGKTGGEVLNLAKEKHSVECFSRGRPVDLALLKACDAAIVFVPGGGLRDIADDLVSAGIPVVSGTTGFDYSRLPLLSAPWIVASNFSLGMNAMFLAAELLGQLDRSARVESFHVHEIHHTRKLDSPSGTALHLKSLLPGQATVSAERTGDVVGYHSLSVRLPFEQIELSHEAFERSVFAAGALYAAEELIPGLAPGLHRFEKILQRKLQRKEDA